VTELEKWPRDVRRASINSFGYGGANAHLIVESVGSYLNNASYGDQIIGKVGDWPLVLPVSAMSTKSLEIQTKQLSGAIEKYDRDTLIRLAYTLAQRRSHLREKDYLLTQAGNDATGKLIQTDAINFVSTTSSNALPIAFIFTGQGAQYAGMGKELLNTESFSITIRQLDNVLQALPPQYRPDWTLEQTILDTPDSSQVNNVTRSQPLCTAIQIALVGMLRSWGVSVSAVVGHSSGEIAAAYTAGLLTATHAILVAYFRGYVVGQQQANGGAMMAAGLGVEAAEKLIKDKGLEGQVCVACVNSPESVTLSGLPEGVEILDLEIKEQGKFARKLETGGRAYHSHMMQEVGGLYEELLGHHISEDVGTKWEGIHQSVKMYSSAGYAGDVLGIFDFTTNSMTAKYWKENLEKPVQFSSAVKNLVSDQGRHHFIEIGPHPALKGPIQQIRTGLKLDNHNLPYASTLIRKQNASLCMKTLAGNLYVHGYKIHWNVVNNIPKCGMTLLHDLPTYPWDYRTDLLWYEPRASVELRNREYVRHELLGSKQLAGDGINWCWRNIIRLSEMPWICGHKVEDQIVFPAAGYLSVAIEAISQSLGVIYKDKDKTIEFRDVHIATALVLPDDSNEPGKGVELHTSMSRQKLSTVTVSSDWYEFSISSWVAGHTTIHCAGSIRVNDSVKIQGSVMVSNIGTFETYSAEKWYAKAKEQGLCFEGPFRSLTSVCTDGNLKRLESLCTTHLIPPGITSHHPGVDHYSMHPITIDTCFQAPIISATGGNIKALRSYLPVFISEAHVRTSGGINPNCEAIIHTRSTKTSFATQQIDSTLRDSSGTPFIDLKNVRFSLYEGKKNEDSYSGSDRQLNSLRHPFLRTRWKPDILRFDLNSQKQVNEYVGEFAKNNQLLEIMPESHANTIGALLDLAGHKKPKLRVMEIAGGSEDHTKQWLSVLDKDTAFPRCFSWDITVVDEEGKLQVEVEGPFVSTVFYLLQEIIATLRDKQEVIVITNSVLPGYHLHPRGKIRTHN
jgi:acyl transferase domain-containing protein